MNANLEPQPKLVAQPDWEEMFHKSEETCRQMFMKCEDAETRADALARENIRLRLVLSAVETMLGRKFDV